MIIIGAVLLIAGLIFDVSAITMLGVVILIIGAVLLLLR